MKRYSLVSIVLLLLISACNNVYDNVPQKYHALLDVAFRKAGNNSQQLKQSIRQVPIDEKEGMAFLISYMPQCDLDSISTNILLNNCHYAYVARHQFEWTQQLPDSVFMNDVLPYCCLNERRDDWRGDFYRRFSKYVVSCSNIFDAIDSVNQNIRKETGVEYNTNRKKADQSPYESIEQGMASCSGLSILLVNAFRSVGIPARIAGTPLWFDDSGNHNWVEVWIDGKWHLTEYYPEGLDQGWVVEKAGNSDPENRDYAIYAASFAPAETTFPLVWDTAIEWIYAENVSNRYIELARQQKNDRQLKENKMPVIIQTLKESNQPLSNSNRYSTKIAVFQDTTIVASGYTSGETQDLNNNLLFILKKNENYTVKYKRYSGKDTSCRFIPEKSNGNLFLF
jgi:hypothetical protein